MSGLPEGGGFHSPSGRVKLVISSDFPFLHSGGERVLLSSLYILHCLELFFSVGFMCFVMCSHLIGGLFGSFRV